MGTLTSWNPLGLSRPVMGLLCLIIITIIIIIIIDVRDRDSSVGIATRYGLDGPGIESQWGRDFLLQSRPALGPNGYWATFPGVKRPGRGVDHPHQSSAKVKERVELYLYSPSGSSWPVLGWTLPLPLPLFTFAYACQIENSETLACLLALNVETVPPLDAPRRPVPSTVTPIYRIQLSFGFG